MAYLLLFLPTAVNLEASTREPSASDLQQYASDYLTAGPSLQDGGRSSSIPAQQPYAHSRFSVSSVRQQSGGDATGSSSRLQASDALAAADDLLEAMSRRRMQNARQSYSSRPADQLTSSQLQPAPVGANRTTLVPGTSLRSVAEASPRQRQPHANRSSTVSSGPVHAPR